MPGTGSTRIDTPDVAGLSLTGDLDLRMLVAMTDWTPAATQNLMSHFSVTSNQRSWRFDLNTAGTFGFLWSVDGTATITKASTAATGRTDGLPLWVRVTHDVDNGAAGNDVIFYTSTDPVTTAPASVTWSQLGTTVTTAGTTSHFDSTTTPIIGAISAGGALLMVGHVHYAEMRSAIAGTVVSSPDFRTAAQITTPNTVFTDPQGIAWTLRSNALWIADVTATGASTLDGVTSAGSGTFLAAITGTGASTLAGVSSAGVGVFTGIGPIPGSGNRMGGNKAIRKPPRLSGTRKAVRRRRR